MITYSPTLNDDTIEFKGRKKDTYRTLISTPGGFTERQLLDELNN